MFTNYENKAMQKDALKQKIVLNAPLRGHNIGDIVIIDVDKDGIPLAQYWRDRFKDAVSDGCIEVIKEKTATKTDKGSAK